MNKQPWDFGAYERKQRQGRAYLIGLVVLVACALFVWYENDRAAQHNECLAYYPNNSSSFQACVDAGGVQAYRAKVRCEQEGAPDCG